jgi:hypothetical protein
MTKVVFVLQSSGSREKGQGREVSDERGTDGLLLMRAR